MSNNVTRSFPLLDIAIRSGGDGRTVEAYAAVWDTPVEVSDGQGRYIEQISRTAFNKTIADRGSMPYPVLFNHGMTLFGTPAERYTMPIGVSVEPPKPDAYGLRTVSRYHNSDTADEALEAIKSGSITAQSFSGRFIDANPKMPRGGYRADASGAFPLVTRTQFGLNEYGPAVFANYPTAVITGVRALGTDDAALAQQLLTALAVADAQLDPIVDALCAADGALDMAQAVIAQILGVGNPDPADPDSVDDMSDMGLMAMNSANLTSLARRLDQAIAARASTTSTDAGEHEPRKHSGRFIVARNNARAALIQRGIRA